MSCATVMPSYDDLSVRAAESCYVLFTVKFLCEEEKTGVA
jgi:hypothetical protein